MTLPLEFDRTRPTRDCESRACLDSDTGWRIASTCQPPSRISQATAVKLPQLKAELGKQIAHAGPLGMVSRELYVPYPRPNVSSVISCDYVGAHGLRRYEQLTYQVFDDVYQDPEIRYSADNGRTWTPWQPDTANDIVRGQAMWWQFVPNGLTPGCHDPQSHKLVRLAMLRGFRNGDPRHVGLGTITDFTFYALSDDDGATWGPKKQLKYEDGPDYSLETRETPQFLAKNRAYFGYNLLVPSSGGIVVPVEIEQIPGTGEDGRPTTFHGVRCFLGRWNQQKADYDWRLSDPVTISRRQSGYLVEPWLAELVDGRLLLDLRGTNAGATPPNVPGRHWYALSKDGGKTWSRPTDWRFDDGSQFLSPATFAKILRHSRTRKLYWFGNISRGPTQGNSPRYPLYLAEVDETRPAIERATLTLIDDYDPRRDTPAVQFSNFFVFENRQTHAFDLYLSPYGQYPNVYQASVYKYVIAIK